jgi:hypothetical protein
MQTSRPLRSNSMPERAGYCLDGNRRTRAISVFLAGPNDGPESVLVARACVQAVPAMIRSPDSCDTIDLPTRERGRSARAANLPPIIGVIGRNPPDYRGGRPEVGFANTAAFVRTCHGRASGKQPDRKLMIEIVPARRVSWPPARWIRDGHIRFQRIVIFVAR